MRRPPLIPITLLLALALAGLLTGRGHAAARRCFPEATGHCIEGRFREYWEQHGGLAAFGYPISPPREEASRETGERYLTQWFERNRFELHPENARPYDVLLGRLGDDRLRQTGRSWESLPRADAGLPHYFPETGQAIDPTFWPYWRTHGLDLGDQGVSLRESLALFGMPISPAQVEVSAIDGQPYLTQWFERARFEYHPEQPAEYRILLGLLAVEIRQHAAAPPPTAAPGPSPSPTRAARPDATAAPAASAQPGASPQPAPSQTAARATETGPAQPSSVPSATSARPDPPTPRPSATAQPPEPSHTPVLPSVYPTAEPTATAETPASYPTAEPTHTALPLP